MSDPEPRAAPSLLSQTAFEAVWDLDLETKVVVFDGNPETMFGYRRDEVGETISWWRERVHPDDIERIEKDASEAIRDGAQGFSNEFRIRRHDASWGWVSARCAILRDGTGRARHLTGVTLDISRLKETESRLRLFTEQIPARATVTDRELRVLWDMGAAYPDNPSTVGKTVPELFEHSPDRDRVLDGCRRALAGESSTIQIDDGAAASQLHLDAFRDPAGSVIGVIGIAFDITDRVRNEQKVRSAQLLLKRVLDLLPVGVAVMNRAGDIVLDNPVSSRIWDRMIESGRDRWASSQGFRRGSGEKIAADQWASRYAIEEGRTTRDELIDIVTFAGQRKTIKNYAAPIHDPDGAITGAVVVNEDVSEQVRAEEALRKTERLLIDAEKLGQTGSWERDLVAGGMINSETNLRLFFGDEGRKTTDFKDFEKAIHPEDRSRVLRQREEMHAGTETASADIEFRVVWPDGSVHWIFGRTTVIRDQTGKPVRVYGTNADITERKRAEQELEHRAQQLETLSRKLIEVQESERRAVARELHDDFGQVLTALKLNLHRLDGDQSESIALVDGALARMRDLAHDLRPPLLDELGLEASLRWYAEREARRAGFTIRLDLAKIEPRAPATVEITCFRVVQEALTNIVRHANAKHVEIEVRKSDHLLDLSVRDDGCGFDYAAARKRAVDGGSQGLLSMQERVALVGGELEIDSAGRGTRVHISVPLPKE
jgi:two-component system sensor histidine kinase UhpB